MRGKRRDGNCRREKGTKVELKKEREVKKVEPRKVEVKLEQKEVRLKREQPIKTGLKSTSGPPKERGALQLWQIQQTLGRGDFIEVSCKLCVSNSFAFCREC